MLQIKNICKQYKTGDLVQNALKDVSVNLRDNEFVAILGPSGSGKTTLLNIIGGLDRYDSGDLIINSISTKKYKDRDWDSYRNHSVGFVFQSYYLIPHQTVLSNVELALTISGVSKAERRKRAIEALEKVGLGNQLHKKPNQMSGGQMQRVAIARALVNNPDILLADEPTGALDTNTSVQVMELLKEVAKEKLVVMVTHNPELANEYATRVINLKDGEILGDTDPYEVSEEKLPEAEHKNMGKSSMSFGTALSLSFNNLRTKKARTLLTAFAGSIGIIGIALILSLSTGVNNYINKIQKDTMTSYPITIDRQTMDLSAFLTTPETLAEEAEADNAGRDMSMIYSNSRQMEMANSMTSSITINNLKDFKTYLDNPESEINNYVGENGIVYTYDVDFDVYTYDNEDVFMNTNPFAEGQTINSAFGSYSMATSTNTNFTQMLPGRDGALISDVVYESYEVVAGSWPQNYDEVVIVVNRHNEINLDALYELGYLPQSEYDEMTENFLNGEEIDIQDVELSFDDILNKTFYVITPTDLYEEGNDGYFTYIGDNKAKVKTAAENGTILKIVGIIRPVEDADNANLMAPVAYTSALSDYLIDHNNNSAVMVAQRNDTEVNVLNGLKFSPADDNEKIEEAQNYLDNLGVSEKAEIILDTMTSMSGEYSEQAEALYAMDETELAALFDQYMQTQMTDEGLLEIYDTYIAPGSYDTNMELFGYIDPEEPSSISIYADSFEDKDSITECISAYNDSVEEEDKIVYTDYIGLLISSITTIINVISYVLIAFVAVSLVVSSIMIGIITYISVLERTKEIGILRAIGASKKNISLVFNAETFIIGLISGAMGVIITLLLLIPGNQIIHAVADTTDVNAVLPVKAGIILVILSMVLTLIGGLIPSSKAAKMDPVGALRTE